MILQQQFRNHLDRESEIRIFTTARERNTSATILCRSVVSGFLERTDEIVSGAEWLGLHVRNVGKVFHCGPKLLKATHKRLCKFVVFATLAQRTPFVGFFNQLDCADTDSWEVNSSMLTS